MLLTLYFNVGGRSEAQEGCDLPEGLWQYVVEQDSTQASLRQELSVPLHIFPSKAMGILRSLSSWRPLI